MPRCAVSRCRLVIRQLTNYLEVYKGYAHVNQVPTPFSFPLHPDSIPSFLQELLAGRISILFIGSLGGLLAGLPLAVFSADLESCLSI